MTFHRHQSRPFHTAATVVRAVRAHRPLSAPSSENLPHSAACSLPPPLSPEITPAIQLPGLPQPHLKFVRQSAACLIPPPPLLAGEGVGGGIHLRHSAVWLVMVAIRRHFAAAFCCMVVFASASVGVYARKFCCKLLHACFWFSSLFREGARGEVCPRAACGMPGRSLQYSAPWHRNEPAP